ncbi:MAG: hypothetical protein WB443_02080 [Nitrososphaeraceae archaeon]
MAIATTGSFTTPVLALKNISTHSGKSSGAVPLIPIATGNPQLDKQIQQFYSCIKKTGHTGGTKPEPSRDEVNGCYFQVFSSNGSSSSTSSSSSFSNSGSHGHGHKHGQKTGIQTQGVSTVGPIPHLY